MGRTTAAASGWGLGCCCWGEQCGRTGNYDENPTISSPLARTKGLPTIHHGVPRYGTIQPRHPIFPFNRKLLSSWRPVTSSEARWRTRIRHWSATKQLYYPLYWEAALYKSPDNGARRSLLQLMLLPSKGPHYYANLI